MGELTGAYSFAYPWMLLAIPIAAILYSISAVKLHGINAASVEVFGNAVKTWRTALRTPVLFSLFWLGFISLTVAAARPRVVEDPINNTEARNLMLVLDISKSMDYEDFVSSSLGVLTRLSAVKTVVSEFIRARPGDRIGLVVFGSAAYLQAPLTLDHELVAAMVEQLDTGIAGSGTAIGDGLGLGVKRIADVPSKSRAIVLLTDGASNAGNVAPLQAAKIAEDLGIKVHTIGIGSSEPTQSNQRFGMFGLTPAQGGEFDEETLKAIASKTGGVYFHASDLEGLKEVYNQIDELETAKTEDILPQRIDERFSTFAALAFVLFALGVILSRTVFDKLP